MIKEHNKAAQQHTFVLPQEKYKGNIPYVLRVFINELCYQASRTPEPIRDSIVKEKFQLHYKGYKPVKSGFVVEEEHPLGVLIEAIMLHLLDYLVTCNKQKGAVVVDWDAFEKQWMLNDDMKERLWFVYGANL